MAKSSTGGRSESGSRASGRDSSSRPGSDGKSRVDERRARPAAESSRPQMRAGPRPPYPKQHQDKPGRESDLQPRPRFKAPRYKPAYKLEDKVAIVTGGDSGIGRAVAVLYAREGADVLIVHLPEEQADADETRRNVEATGRRCVTIAGDLTDADFCQDVVDRAIEEFGQLDILVSNAAWQNRKETIEQVSEDEWDRTFRTNVYALFHLAKAAVPHLRPGSSIIATGSETGIEGNKSLLDYSATKGAIHAFVKSLAQNLIEKGIRVNCVAPGPVWTPLNPSDQGTSPEQVSQFGGGIPMKRPAQPEEIAPAYVFLASDADSSFVTGIVLQEMGGKITGG